MVFTNVEQEAAFWEKVQMGNDYDDCMIWTGAFCPSSGYGKFRIGKRIWNTHRLIWEHSYGKPLGNKLVVRHVKCRNRLCVNVRHLEIGTYRDNWLDSVRDGTAKPFRKGHTPWNKGKRFVDVVELDCLIAGLDADV